MAEQIVSMKEKFVNLSRVLSNGPERRMILALMLGACLGLLAGCGGGSDTPPPRIETPREKLSRALQGAVDDLRKQDSGVQSALIYVDAPSLGRAVLAASGQPDPAKATSFTAETGLRVASVGKMFTATTVMRLIEQGQLSLDTPVSARLPASISTRFRTWIGADAAAALTIRHLLSHTSGLPDYFNDGPANAAGQTAFLQAQFAQPDRLWTLADTVNWAIDRLQPLSAPGAAFHYSDTNYQLLGLIIEETTGQPLQDVVRAQVFNRAAMTGTWAQFREAPRSALARFYLGSLDVSDFQTLSADWAGGGWIATPSDLVRFVRSLNGTELITAGSRTEMIKGSAANALYGLGVQVLSSDSLGPVYGHSGFYGTWVLYWAERDAVVVVHTGQSETSELALETVLQRIFIAAGDALPKR